MLMNAQPRSRKEEGRRKKQAHARIASLIRHESRAHSTRVMDALRPIPLQRGLQPPLAVL